MKKAIIIILSILAITTLTAIPALAEGEAPAASSTAETQTAPGEKKDRQDKNGEKGGLYIEGDTLPEGQTPPDPEAPDGQTPPMGEDGRPAFPGGQPGDRGVMGFPGDRQQSDNGALRPEDQPQQNSARNLAPLWITLGVIAAFGAGLAIGLCLRRPKKAKEAPPETDMTPPDENGTDAA